MNAINYCVDIYILIYIYITSTSQEYKKSFVDHTMSNLFIYFSYFINLLLRGPLLSLVKYNHHP